MTEQTGEQPQPLCSHCGRRLAAYVLDVIREAVSAPKSMFPAWACEGCVAQLVDEMLDVTEAVSVCRVDSYR